MELNEIPLSGAILRRWAGVSPKRFLHFLTLEHAKGLLLRSEPILQTAFASGLSGPARLHDLFISNEGVTPGEFNSRGLAFLIPCHRVIRGIGAFGGYRWGAVRNRAIIGWEAAQKETIDSGAHLPLVVTYNRCMIQLV